MVSNINTSSRRFSYPEYDSDTDSDHAAQIYTKICELIIKRENVNRASLLNLQTDTTNASHKRLDSCVFQNLKNGPLIYPKFIQMGQLGHPIIIEFLLIPSVNLKTNCSTVNRQLHQPAFLIEQWMIQFLPQRLVTDCVNDLSCLFDEIISYCSSSVVNRLLFKNKTSSKAIEIKNLQCVYRITNLRGANIFSSCWFLTNTDEIGDRNKINSDGPFSSDYGAPVLDSPAICIPNRTQTTMRTKFVKRSYLCNQTSHTHQTDILSMCSSHAFTRLSIGATDVLDTTVTSILELPTCLPESISTLNFTLQNGAMSLPSQHTEKIDDPTLPPNSMPNTKDNLKCKISQRNNLLLPQTDCSHTMVLKSPMVIVSDWRLPTSVYLSPKSTFEKPVINSPASPPRKQKRVIWPCEAKLLSIEETKNDQFINEFNLLKVQQDCGAPTLFSSSTPTSHCKIEEGERMNQKSIQPREVNGICISSGRGLLKSSLSSTCSERTISSTQLFHCTTGLPLQSSPVPTKRNNSISFDFDDTLPTACRLSKCSQVFHYTEKETNKMSTTTDTVDKISETPQNIMSSFQSNTSVPVNILSSSSRAKKRPNTLSIKTSNNTCYLHSTKCSSAPTKQIVPTLHSSQYILSTSIANTPQPISSQQLLINFEESMLNGRIPPSGVVEGFTLEIGASGSFFPSHLNRPVSAYFFDLSDDKAPSPYLGYVDLTNLSNKRGYHVPKNGSIQLTLFNPSGSVLKMFVIQYNLDDMPANCQTFVRQRTVYMPVRKQSANRTLCQHQHAHILPVESSTSNILDADQTCLEVNSKKCNAPFSNCPSSSFGIPSELSIYNQPSVIPLTSHLRYLVHLRFHTTKSNNLYLHTDIRLIFARDKFEYDTRVAAYEMLSFVDAPSNPRYSPKK